MTKDEIKAGNTLISDFLGTHGAILGFDLDWDLIMQAISKLSIEINFTLSGNIHQWEAIFFDDKLKFSGNGFKLSKTSRDPIEATWLAVVDYLKTKIK